jgi:elongation factor Tu
MSVEKELVIEIKDVINVTGMGLVVSGYIQSEEICLGNKVLIEPEYLPPIESEVTRLIMLNKMPKIAYINDIAGIVLKGVDKKQVKKGMKIYKLA